MAEPPRTSFIPKQGATATKANLRPRRTFNVFNFLMTVVFLGAIILAVGVYLLQIRSEADLEAKKAELTDIKDTFSRADIESLRELNKRLDTAERLVGKHLSPSVVFETLERRTQGEIQFQNFSYTLNESGTLALSLNGSAPRFNTVALQSQEFAEDSVIERALFSNLGVTYSGEGPDVEQTVRFTATAKVDTSLMRYEPPVAGDTDESEQSVNQATTSGATSGTTTPAGGSDAQESTDTDADTDNDTSDNE